MADFRYEGSELELFQHATNWKSYYARLVSPYLRGSVLEVGAGIGATAEVLLNPAVARWVCLEPDGALAAQIPSRAPGCEIRVGMLADFSPDEMFDSIIYIDVLEHIENDVAELIRASSHLAPDGHLLVLSPAHQFLFSEFDRAIGHCRRYSRASLGAVAPRELRQVALQYLDSVGFFASLANRLLLKQGHPDPTQIALWDRVMIPMSRITDRLLGFNFGKTVLGVWKKT